MLAEQLTVGLGNGVGVAVFGLYALPEQPAATTAARAMAANGRATVFLMLAR
jgi:hypothetical protein